MGGFVDLILEHLRAINWEGPAAFVVAVMAVVAVAAAVVTVRFGDRAIGELGPDPGVIVSDEACGQAITYLWLWQWSSGNVTQLVVLTVVGFLVFRLLDILKPFPCRNLEKLPMGWGVLADDLMAGVYAAIVLQICIRFFIG